MCLQGAPLLPGVRVRAGGISRPSLAVLVSIGGGEKDTRKSRDFFPRNRRWTRTSGFPREKVLSDTVSFCFIISYMSLVTGLV